MQTPSEFAELIERIRTGDAQAMERLLQDYGDALKREVRFTLLDARLKQIVAESDVYQSVVIRFFSGMRDGDFQFDSPADLLRLLKGIARARIAELVRYWHAGKRDLNRNSGLEMQLAVQHTGTSTAVLDALEQDELLAAVDGLLSERDRQILEWRNSGRSWSQIAEALAERSPEAVRKRHERSLAEIQRTLSDRRSSPAVR